MKSRRLVMVVVMVVVIKLVQFLHSVVDRHGVDRSELHRHQ
jgi:hypothetical protein